MWNTKSVFVREAVIGVKDSRVPPDREVTDKSSSRFGGANHVQEHTVLLCITHKNRFQGEEFHMIPVPTVSSEKRRSRVCAKVPPFILFLDTPRHPLRIGVWQK